MNQPHEQLDSRIQRWLFQQGWSDLREIQKQAISPILAGDRDVLISASTAAGKTEAFFLPALSAVVQNQTEGLGVLYISPLKALINDQYRRLEDLCERLELAVTPWHGDASRGQKTRARKNPNGVLLITPESLESLMVRDPGWVKQAFNDLRYVVIDEFHAFIGTERGFQLLSLLNRLEHLLGRYTQPVPRVALSATLGDLGTVPLSLRPNQRLPCDVITSSKSLKDLRLQVKGYTTPLEISPQDGKVESEAEISQALYDICRGGTHLVFANSRQRTESLSARLTDLCEKAHVPNEFFPHHGSLSKEIRESLEARLQKETLPTTALCTMTLELGIDIGKVDSVAQVTAPHSVSSLRQRLGRSGRRNGPATLRMLITENELSEKSHIVDMLRLELVQSLAMIRLLIQNQWFEPADTRQLHLSTLLHQVLAVIGQWGGVRPDQLYKLLCETGPFHKVTVSHFKALLSHMGKTELLTQLGSGELVLGPGGESLVDHYSFYAVFKTPEEYRIVAGNRVLGALPVDSLVMPDQQIIFGGRRWLVMDVDIETKTIHVSPTKGGRPPKFGGEGLGVHDIVRQEMQRIYQEGDYRIQVGGNKVDYIDATANRLFCEGADTYSRSKLAETPMLQRGASVYIFPWLGDKVVNTLTVLLMYCGRKASHYAGVIEVSNSQVEGVRCCLAEMLHQSLPSETQLAQLIPEKCVDKYDEYLPDELLQEGLGQRAFDIEGARVWMALHLC